ncbi:MAG: hypothetical protein NT007_08355 [Candidatus Kapabacteria bacterium]|nr:hypothetical protein [Candidatus Kapabacteria bacterium]
MASGSFKRNYNLTDSELGLFSLELCSNMTRDLSNLAVFGITSLAVTSLQSICVSFQNLPTDEEYRGDIEIATAAKNDLALQVKDTTRDMATRVSIKYGANSGQYARLGLKNVSTMSDDTLIVASRRVMRVVTEYKTDLASVGLTQGMIDDYEDIINSFEDAKITQLDKIALRETKVTDRVNKGNDLYGHVTDYCDLGKRVWNGVDPAKESDYVIYGANGGGGVLTAPTNFVYNFHTNDFSWDAVTNATSYQIETSDNGTDWAEIYADAAMNFNYIPTSGVDKYYRVRARNSSGFGEYATEMHFTYYDSLSSPSGLTLGLTGAIPPLTIHVDWNTVTGATNYKVYRSIVNTGGSAGTYSLVDTVGTNSYSEETIEDRRYYYYVIAINSYLESTACSAMFVDVPVNPA